MNFNNYNDTQLNEIIQNSCQRIFNQLGKGHTEKIYHKALKYELDSQNIYSDIERHVNVIYTDTSGKNHVLESERIDMYIFGNDEILALKWSDF